jgi:hypothetical protein
MRLPISSSVHTAKEWQRTSQLPKLCTYHDYQMLLEKATQDQQEINNKIVTSIGLFYL